MPSSISEILYASVGEVASALVLPPGGFPIEAGTCTIFWPKNKASILRPKIDIKKNESPVAPTSFKNVRLSMSETPAVSFLGGVTLVAGFFEACLQFLNGRTLYAKKISRG